MVSKSPESKSKTSAIEASSARTEARVMPASAGGGATGSGTPALTTLQFWQQQLSVYQAEQTAAQSDLTVAQAAQKAANAQLADDTKKLGQLTSDIAAKRAQLATTTIPADANKLVSEIADLIIQQRGLQGKVLDDQDAIDAAQANINAATATLARATARVASVQANIAKVTTDDKLRQGLKQAIAAAPLSTLKADAAAFNTSATVTNAKKHMGTSTNFPQELITIAGKRYDTRITGLTNLQTAFNNAQDALGTGLVADAGKQGTVAQKRTTFQRAQGALSQYVVTAVDRFNRAKAVMQMLEAIEVAPAGTVPDILTDAEKAQLAALATAGKAAEAKAEPIDADLNAVLTAKNDLDAQILTQINADVDTLGTDPTIAAKRTAIATALKTYTDAIAAFAAAASPNKNDLDQWEAVIPDAAWKVVLDFKDGLATLDDLSKTDPATLASAMDSAEHDYTDALANAEKARRRADYYSDAIALRQELRDLAQVAITKRLPSAIRGDTY